MLDGTSEVEAGSMPGDDRKSLPPSILTLLLLQGARAEDSVANTKKTQKQIQITTQKTQKTQQAITKNI